MSVTESNQRCGLCQITIGIVSFWNIRTNLYRQSLLGVFAKPMSNTYLQVVTGLLFGLLSLSTSALSDAEFRTSLDAARQGQWDQVAENASQHVLAPYIEYHRIKRGLPDVSAADVRAYATENADSPLSRWIVRHATLTYGAARKWNEVLSLNEYAPADAPGRCIYYRAKLIKDQAAAFDGGRQLWLSGSSRPEQCDDLFKAMLSRGEINEQAIWQRAVLALQAGNRSLSDYLLRKLPAEWKVASSTFRQLRSSPERLLTLDKTFPDGVERSDMGYAVLAYLVRRKPADVAELYPQLSEAGVLSEAQLARLGNMLAARSYKFDAEERPDIVDQLLSDLGDGNLIGPVLREAIAQSDWDAVLAWTDKVQGSERESGYHMYWRGRALEALGQSEAAHHAYTKAASAREFYGFLAAEKLALPYELKQTKTSLQEGQLEAVADSPAIARIRALWAIGEEGLAADEWNFTLLRHPSDTPVYAELAKQNGWPALAVQATISGRHWNLLEHRFPLAYQDEFSRWAEEYDLDPSLLMSIARRESAFNPHARSPVGARGLMQIMPATAKQVAREKNLVLHDVNEDLMDYRTNIPLGSYYVRSLLERYQGNLIAALAGYNAGPHKVDRWLKDAPVAYDQFIESIPYRETRDYVKAVLAYRVIFSSLKGKEVTAVLDPDERVFAQQLSQADSATPVRN